MGPIYSHTVVSNPGQLVFIAGQLSRDADGAVVGDGDMAAQLTQVHENLNLALRAAGATLDDVVATTTYTTDLDLYFQHIYIRQGYFTGDRLPTSTAVEISRLSDPRLLVEVNATASLPPP